MYTNNIDMRVIIYYVMLFLELQEEKVFSHSQLRKKLRAFPIFLYICLYNNIYSQIYSIFTLFFPSK